MRILTLGSAITVAAIALASCGGTSSETPWPVEPEGPALGPTGETGPVGTVRGAPEAGSAAPAAGPAAPDAGR